MKYRATLLKRDEESHQTKSAFRAMQYLSPNDGFEDLLIATE
jgi:hypothetical protein